MYKKIYLSNSLISIYYNLFYSSRTAKRGEFIISSRARIAWTARGS